MNNHTLTLGRTAVAIAAALWVLPPQALASDDLAHALEGYEIVVLGEIHDNPNHHETQAAIVAELKPEAIVFEMIEPATARKITPRQRRSKTRLETALGWADSGWPDFAMYYPIFQAAPDAAIFGGALPRETVRQAVSDGAAQVFGSASEMFGLNEDLSEDELEKRTTLQQEAHCNALPEEILPGMVEAQRLRDAAISKATIAAFAHAQATSDTPTVVVIAGNGHAREDWGVPAMLSAFYNDASSPKVAALGQYESDSAPDGGFTLTTSANPPEREDPCAVFAK